jgi:hypothetical protein
MTEVDISDPLVGKCFVIFRGGNWRNQGVVRARVTEQVYLIQYYEALMGEPSTMRLATIEEMTKPGDRTGDAIWEFFEDDAHLRSWCSDHPVPREGGRDENRERRRPPIVLVPFDEMVPQGMKKPRPVR